MTSTGRRTLNIVCSLKYFSDNYFIHVLFCFVDSSEAVLILCRVKPSQLSPGEGTCTRNKNRYMYVPITFVLFILGSHRLRISPTVAEPRSAQAGGASRTVDGCHV